MQRAAHVFLYGTLKKNCIKIQLPWYDLLPYNFVYLTKMPNLSLKDSWTKAFSSVPASVSFYVGVSQIGGNSDTGEKALIEVHAVVKF